MTKTQILIAANSSQSQGMTVTLESTSIFLGIIVSVSMIVGIAIKAVSKFNSIANEIRDLREDINKLSTIDTTIREMQSSICNLDKRFDIHMRDYENRKETVQFLFGQLNEKLDHKSKRFEGEIKDIEGYLQKQQGYTIRASASD